MIIQDTGNPLKDLLVSRKSIIDAQRDYELIIGSSYITMSERQDIIKRKYELIMSEDYVVRESQHAIHVAITNWKQYQEDLRSIDKSIKELSKDTDVI